MNKSKVLNYVHHNIENELKIIEKIHNISKGTSFPSNAEDIAREDKRYLICMEDIKCFTSADLFQLRFTETKGCH